MLGSKFPQDGTGLALSLALVLRPHLPVGPRTGAGGKTRLPKGDLNLIGTSHPPLPLQALVSPSIPRHPGTPSLPGSMVLGLGFLLLL